MAFNIHYFKWLCYLNGKPLEQCMGECHYCHLKGVCFYHPKILSMKTGVIIICKNAHEEIIQLTKQLPLINDLLNINVCQDVKNLILNIIYNHFMDQKEVPCLKLRLYQDDYLAFKFTDLSVDQLKKLIHRRQLKCPKNKNKIDHIVVLQQDLYEKRKLWRNITYCF